MRGQHHGTPRPHTKPDRGLFEDARTSDPHHARRPGALGQYGNASPQFPPARDMAMYCYQHMDNLNDWENEFITNMVSLTRLGYPLSIKRQDKLETIYLKLGGRI